MNILTDEQRRNKILEELYQAVKTANSELSWKADQAVRLLLKELEKYDSK